MKTRDILGQIDCPYCGTAGGMRITPDRNGAPFGYCEANCAGQLRIGGERRRVDAFYAKYPHVRRPDQAAAPKAAPAPAAPAPAPTAAPAPAPTTAPPPPARRPMSGVDWLLHGGTPR